MSKGIKSEGVKARKKVVNCISGSDVTSNSKKTRLSITSPSSRRKIQVIESVLINKGGDKACGSGLNKYKESNSIFVSPSTKKEFLVLDPDINTKKKKQ